MAPQTVVYILDVTLMFLGASASKKRKKTTVLAEAAKARVRAVTRASRRRSTNALTRSTRSLVVDQLPGAASELEPRNIQVLVEKFSARSLARHSDVTVSQCTFWGPSVCSVLGDSCISRVRTGKVNLRA